MTEALNQTFAMRSDDPHIESSMLASSPGFITNSGTPDEAEFADIRERFGDPRANVKPDDYYVFRMVASGDGLDSYYTRQDVETSFDTMMRDLIKGQALLGSHLMATFPYGSSFQGSVEAADPTRHEYEGSFFPQWDTPELRTKNWLIGKYFIGRDVEVNGQSTNHLIRSLELGNVRKASISFMVGQYVCGIDGLDLISTMFGPMPDEECNHFPGIAYDDGKGAKQIAWALMKNNTLVETSLVYKNASPSSMLLRKAEALASRGQLSAKAIDQLESRFQVRLPRYQQRVWTQPVETSGTAGVSNVISTTTNGSTWYTTVTAAGEETVQEELDMAGRRRGGDDAARELAREALTAEPEPTQEESAETDGEAVSDAEIQPTDAAPETDAPVSESVDETEVAGTDEGAEEPTEAAAEAEAAEAPADETPETPDATEATEPETPDAVSEASEPAEEREAEAEVAAEAAAPAGEESEGDEDPKNESTREEDVVATFVAAADRLVSSLARSPDAFDSGQLAVTARAERAIDLALIDAGCDVTVGSHVARVFETRSKAISEQLGTPITVEAIRSLQARADLGDTLYEELVKDAVAARTGAQGESFNAPKYRDLLMSARDVAYVKEEIASWKDAKGARFTPGRQSTPRPVADVRPTKEELKRLPEAPAGLGSTKASPARSTSILEPRKK